MKIIGYLNYDYEQLPDPYLLTHINFSFAELYVRNGVYDHFELCGQNIEKLINVVKLKEINTELKVLISFTSQIHNKDNFQDGGFSAICNSEEQTEHLINDIIKFIEDYNLDGVDLNWEYPCEKWSGQTPLDNDRHNFNIFVKKLKHSLPKEKILTYASYVFPNQKFCDLVLQQYIEHINVMCYDLGEGTKKMSHNGIDDTNRYNCKMSIKKYKNTIDLQKYILGIPFYGRISFREEPYILTLKEINKLLESKPSKYKTFQLRDKIPFLYKDYKGQCSFENEFSLYEKIKLVKDNNLGGIMIWNLTQDTDDFYYLKMINNIIKNIKRNEK